MSPAVNEAVLMFHSTVPLASGGRLTVSNHKGGIDLSSWDREELSVRARIEAPEGTDPDYALRIVEALRIEISGDHRDRDLRLDHSGIPNPSPWPDSDSRRRLPRVYYEIHAPRRLDLEVCDHGSRIRIARFDGSVGVTTHKGSVEVAEVAGAFRLKTHKGDLRLSRLRGRFDLQSHEGRCDLEAVALDGDCSFSTHRGDIVLRLSSGQPLSLAGDLSRRARFRSELGSEPRDQTGGPLYGELNGGGPTLRVASSRGEILLQPALPA